MAEDFKSFFFTKAKYLPFWDNDMLSLALNIYLAKRILSFIKNNLFFIKNVASEKLLCYTKKVISGVWRSWERA